MPTKSQFSWYAFILLYCGPIWFAFLLLGLLLIILPHGWQYTCEYTGTIEPGPTYSSLFLALPALARPLYGNPTTRIYGLATAAVSFTYWGTACSPAYALDVILVAYFPLFLWESLAIKEERYKIAFAVCALLVTPLLFVYGHNTPSKTPFTTHDALLVTAPFAIVAIAITKVYKWQKVTEKEVCAVALAVTAAVLLALRTKNHINKSASVAAFGTTTWGHICAGLALYVASVDTDLYMTSLRPLCTQQYTKVTENSEN